MSHSSLAAATVPAGPPAFPLPTPPLTTKPRGSPNLGLAPRCGARTRAGCPCQAPAIRGKVRCPAGQARGQAPHGGRSTGPRSPEGLASLRAAHTVHGGYSAEVRALNRHDLTALRRGRVGNAAVRHIDRLPPDLAARLMQMPSELLPAQDRAVLRAETDALAPWRAAIAQAGFSRSAAKARPPVVAGRRGAPTEALAPDRAPAAPDTGPTKPLVPFPPAGPAAPAPVRAPNLHPAAHAVPAKCAHANAQPEPCVPIRAPTAHNTSATEPLEPFLPAGPVTPAPMLASDPHAEAHAVPARCGHENGQPEPYVPIRASTAHDTGATEPLEPFPPAEVAAPATTPFQDPRPGAPAAPARRAHTTRQPEPFVPEGAPGPRRTAAPEPFVPVPAAAPAIPPALPNRAERRRILRPDPSPHPPPSRGGGERSRPPWQDSRHCAYS